VQWINPRREGLQSLLDEASTEQAKLNSGVQPSSCLLPSKCRHRADANPQRSGNKLHYLDKRLIEQHFLESTRNFLPFSLRGGAQVLGIGIEALMQNADHKQRR
jgi:hypothetical protein